MSEIEKLMQNADVKKDWKPLPYGDIEEYYPEFTAEKQLKLIKYIALNGNIDYVKYYYEAIKGVWVFVCVTVTELASEMPKVYGAYHEEFEQALAGLINNLWIDLTDTEKAEIKEILK